jgi:hypothetical protein
VERKERCMKYLKVNAALEVVDMSRLNPEF